ncbi:hypothetical protein [Eikenella sp. NML96-A-049]|uniref:hypothetical protein n=1 Tax=Eikenella sp. NML96-A-049 TaxID=1809061 RepID=UPI000B0EAD81|nr:hypothetical protein [Eikenella sp. NML96-A-049]
MHGQLRHQQQQLTFERAWLPVILPPEPLGKHAHAAVEQRKQNKQFRPCFFIV